MEGSRIDIIARDCNIYLYKDANLAAGIVKANIYAYHNTEEDTAALVDSKLIVSNYFESLQTCEINLYVKEEFPATSLKCIHMCWIEQMDENIKFKSLSVTSNPNEVANMIESRLKLKDVTMDSLKLDFKGTVTIESLTSDTGDISVTDGDV